MSNVKPFKTGGKPVEWKPGKYDGFKLAKLGDYKHQKGSGRSTCLEVAKDGMLVGTWTKKCAELGFESKFPVNCIQKLMTTANPGWGFSDTNQDGLSYEEVLHARSEDSAKGKRVKKEAKAKKKEAKASKPKRAKRAKGTDSQGRVVQQEAEGAEA